MSPRPGRPLAVQRETEVFGEGWECPVVALDVTVRRRAEDELRRLNGEPREALAKAELRTGVLPTCCSCRKIRDDQGYWSQVEEYVRDHSEAQFSHGICPECTQRLYPGLSDAKPGTASRAAGRRTGEGEA